MKYIFLKSFFSLFSIFILALIGVIGEGFINMLHEYFDSRNIQLLQEVDLPYFSDFFYRNFLLNRNHFALSLTPFMISVLLIVGINPIKINSSKYWIAFGAIWLLAIVYILIFVFALILPFFCLCRTIGDSIVPTIVFTINIIIVIIAITYFLLNLIKKWKTNNAS